MSVPELGAYVSRQLQAGYSKDQIRQALKVYGYSENDIASALGNPAGQSSVPNKLAEYIARQLSLGYSREQIQSFLMSYGYPIAAVQEAMQQSSHQKVVHEIHVSGKTIFLVFLLLVGLGAVGGGLYLLSNRALVMDYQLEIPDRADYYSPGDTLIIKNIFTKLSGTKKDIKVTYTMTDGSGTVVDAWSETILLAAVGTKAVTRKLPEDIEPGRYMLKGKVESDSVVESEDSFLVREEELCSNRQKDPGEENTDCGGPCAPCANGNCSDGIRNDGEEDIDCGGPCAPCAKGNCSDGIRNDGEEDIDCGGPCEPCIDTCFDQKKNKGEEGIDCGGPCKPCETCEDGIKNQDEEATDCGGVCEPCKPTPNAEFLQQAKNIAGTDSSAASNLCSGITETFWADTCFIEVAKLSNTSSYCAKAGSIYRRDNECYIHFVALGNYDVCENIVDAYIRMNCESLKTIRAGA